MKMIGLVVIGTMMLGCQDTFVHHDQCPIVSVKFSPNGGAEEAIVAGIDKADKSIKVSAYSFTATNIADALIRAHSRGVIVEVVIDREATGNPHSVVKQLRENGIEVFVDGKHAIHHNKIVIIDRAVVFTGSYNFSKGASEKNAENSISIGDKQIAETYVENWELHRAHSSVLE